VNAFITIPKLKSNIINDFFVLNISKTTLDCVASFICVNGIHKNNRMNWKINPKKFKSGGIHDNKNSPNVQASPNNMNPEL
jgi:hypothetical protein